jgi:hypothetical protein
MIVPIYQEIFELYVVETKDAFYNLGILYRRVQVKDKELVQIEKIHIEEV